MKPSRPNSNGRLIALKPLVAALLAAGLAGGALAAPSGGVVRAGDASIANAGAQTRIEQRSARAVIDWRAFGIGATEQVLFRQPSAAAATLNRVTGDQASVLLGRLDANGQVLLVNPNGIVIGGGAQINVGSLIASTSNIGNDNFMNGRLLFDRPGKPGAGIANHGSITAAQGGLVALVAPHVRNDGWIQAQLGKVVLGAADTFTIDLFGDSLVNLALSDAHLGQLRGANGEPVSSLLANAGTIDVAGGRAVLVTAATAKSVLDQLINTSGVIRADSAVAQGGRILLLGEGGTVEAGGTLSARGARGGTIEVLGGDVRIASGALLEASGTAGGGVIHAGGAFQGSGTTYRAQNTTVEPGTVLRANALERGDGGEVVVWSDGHTAFAGDIQARGGANGGDGGRMEVSGKGTLAFQGTADASAPGGVAGSLLLDPAILDIGLAEAGLISRVLRTGTSTSLAADIDINVNSAIDGRGRIAGGGLTLTAGNNINVNDFVVTDNGAINLFATSGTVAVASGKAVFAGSAPITVRTGGTLHSGPFLTSGALALRSTAASVAVDTFIDGGIGRVDIDAALDVDVNQPIVNLQRGNPLNVTAGRDINVNAQVDGRGGVAGGAVGLTAARHVNVNDFVVTHNGRIDATATNGAVTVAADKGLFSGTAPIAVSGKTGVALGMLAAGSLSATSSAGSLALNGIVDGTTGRVDITAGTDVNINQPVLNLRTGNPLNVTAGQDINVNAQIDGRGGVAGGAVTLSAGRNIVSTDAIVTDNGAIGITASGAISVAAGTGLFAGSAPISVSAGGNVGMGALSSGTVTLASSTGAVTLSGIVDGNTGAVTIGAGTDVNINQPVLNLRTGSPFNITAGQDINVNAQVDGRDGVAGGAVTMTAGRNLALNQSIVTDDGAISLTATGGALSVASGMGLFSGTAPIAVKSASSLTTVPMITTGTLRVESSAGSITVATPIDGATGAVTLIAAGAVDVNQPIANPRSDAPLSVTAGGSINVNAQIDGRDALPGTPSGTTTLSAGQSINLNQDVVTENAALTLAAQNGTVVTAPGKGLFAGSAPISVSAGATLDTGILSTTGALTIASTAGGVNVNVPIGDATGAVAITAAGTVNVNQPITNLKTGNPLNITAGGDLVVNAQIDGRDGAAAGGTLTLVAGNDLRLFDHLTTNDGAINLTALTGSVYLAPVQQDGGLLILAAPKQVRAGSAPITIVSGGDFSNGAPPPQPIPAPPPEVDTNISAEVEAYVRGFLKEYVQLVTTGALNITSTSGSVNVIAPISDETGPVTLTAGNAINVKHNIASNNQPITLNGGSGGIKVFAVDNTCGNTGPCQQTTPVDARNANLTLNSVGNVAIVGEGVATSRTLTIDTRSQIVSGSVGNSRGSSTRPAVVVLIADQGIPSFNVGTAGDVSATSIAGSINLGVFFPGKLRITTGTPGNPATDCTTCDITTGGFVGQDVILNAGGSVNFYASEGGTVELIARAGNVNLGPIYLHQLTASAGTDVVLGSLPDSLVWIGSSPNQSPSGGPLSLTAGRDIVTSLNSPIHISNSQSLTLSAGRNVTLNLLETLGPVNITASTGNIDLKNPIGPHIVNNTCELDMNNACIPDTAQPDFNPGDLGVASLSLSAPSGSITMNGARAEGSVTIQRGTELSTSRDITSKLGAGAVTVTDGQGNVVVFVNPGVAIGDQDQIRFEGPILPAISPGPTVPSPAAPGIASVGPAGLPLLAEIPVVGQPDTVNGGGAPGDVSQIAGLPGSTGGTTIASPAATSDEGTVDTESARRAAQQAESSDSGASGGDGALVALAGDGAEEQSVVCPAGVAPGTKLKRRNAGGKETTVTCK